MAEIGADDAEIQRFHLWSDDAWDQAAFIASWIRNCNVQESDRRTPDQINPTLQVHDNGPESANASSDDDGELIEQLAQEQAAREAAKNV